MNTVKVLSRTLMMILSLILTVASVSQVFTKLNLKVNSRIDSLSAVRLNLLEAIQERQSSQSRKLVESLIQDLHNQAKIQSQKYIKPIEAGSFRTVWTSTSADTPIGNILGQNGASILGGDSWQIINKELTTAENIVYWKPLNIRMVGKARIKSFSNKITTGYDLTIKGLEFRYGENGVPEANFKSYNPENITNKLTIISLKDDQELKNGKGKLDVLYNDGLLRITRDNDQKLTYVHIKEPLSSDLKNVYNLY